MCVCLSVCLSLAQSGYCCSDNHFYFDAVLFVYFFLESAVLFRFYPRILWLEKIAWSIFSVSPSSLLDSSGGLCGLHGQQTVCRRKEGSLVQRDSVARAGSSF